MHSSIGQMADHFMEIQRRSLCVAEIVMNPADFRSFYEQTSYDSGISLTGAPWVSGEIVGKLWGAAIRLSNGVNRDRVRLSDPDKTLEVEGYILGL
jgi:hypothetical protein